MSKDDFLRSMLSDKVNMTPNGFVADQLSPEQFKDCHELIFDSLFEIHTSDISGIGATDGSTRMAHRNMRVVEIF